MVRHDVRQLAEPPQRQLGQDLALVRDRRRQHDVVDAHPVGGDQDEVVTVRVQIADLAGIDELHGPSGW